MGATVDVDTNIDDMVREGLKNVTTNTKENIKLESIWKNKTRKTRKNWKEVIDKEIRGGGLGEDSWRNREERRLGIGRRITL